MIRVLGIGDNVADKYMHTMTMYPGGNALNFSVHSKILGYESAFIGNFGDDAEAEYVYDTIQSLGIDVSHCRFWIGENGVAKVKIQNGERIFIGSNMGGVSNQHPLELTRIDEKYIGGFDLAHTSIFSHMESQLSVLRRAARWLSMDLSNRADYAYMKLVCPMADCICISCDDDTPEVDIMDMIDNCVSFGCRHMVIVTCGSKGALISVDGTIYRQSPCLVKAIDTMGAGDSFITCFLTHYIDSMKYALDFPEASRKYGVATVQEFKDLAIRTGLYKAAVYSSQICQKDGSFGYGKEFG